METGIDLEESTQALDDYIKEINEYFGAVAVEMEGCAIAQVATRNKIPFIVTRAISDLADGKTAEYQNEFEKKISEISTQTIKIFLKNLQ